MSNYNKQQQQKRSETPAKTSLRELSEFHPRLSMRAAVSNKINEDALNAIQLQHQPQSPSSSPLHINENQGHDLIQNLTRYVGSDGLMKDSVDLQGYAELMQCEVSSPQQILLLKILVATLKSDSSMSTRIIDCEALMIVLGMWLSSVEQDKLLESILAEKILEILSRLNFTVELLVKYKFGRVIKKIAQQKEKISSKNKTSSLNIDLATKLFDSWSALANKSEIPNIPRRKSEEDIEKKDELDDEIVIRPDSPPQEAKSMKRTSIIALQDDEEGKKMRKTSEQPKNKRKSVNFPDAPEKLCKVILFERAPEEYEFLSDGSASRDSYLHADVGEASKAFGHSLDMDESLEASHNFKPWKELEVIEGIVGDRPDGIDSEEKIIQHQRERSVLSVNYYSLSEVPPSPSEDDVDTASDDPSNSVKIIPIRPNEATIKQVVMIKQMKPTGLVVPPIISSDLFMNLISSNSNYNNLLNPFASNEGGSWNNTHQPVKSSPSLLSSQWNDNSYNNNSNCKSESKYSSYQTQPMAKETGHRGYYAKSICKYYRSGKPSSCRLGSSCRFIHQD